MVESLTLPQRSACCSLDEGDRLTELLQLFRSSLQKERTFLFWRKRTFSFWDDSRISVKGNALVTEPAAALHSGISRQAHLATLWVAFTFARSKRSGNKSFRQRQIGIRRNQDLLKSRVQAANSHTKGGRCQSRWNTSSQCLPVLVGIGCAEPPGRRLNKVRVATSK